MKNTYFKFSFIVVLIALCAGLLMFSHGRAHSTTPANQNTFYDYLLPQGGHGVDYAPGHYPLGDARNDEAQANVYAEIVQLQKAGFNTVRLYGDPGKVWINVINAANDLGMKVVYQLALCELGNGQNGTCTESQYNAEAAAAVQQLQNVYHMVGKAAFVKTVKLIIVGNEILGPDAKTSANKIVTTINTVNNQFLQPNQLTIPLTVSLQADVWIAAKDPGRQTIATALKAVNANAPIAINVYPFQWSVPALKSMDDNASSNPHYYRHTVPYYVKTIQQAYGMPVMITESGWATNGKFILGANHAQGSLTGAEAYYQLLYPYATSHKIPLLAFMAFDTPTKDAGSNYNPNMTSENYYGVFSKSCALKSENLLPNKNYNATYNACGPDDTLFTFAGGSNTAQPFFSIKVTKENGDTYTMTVPTRNRLNQGLTPWPTLTLKTNDQVTLFAHSGASCTNVVASVNPSHQGGNWKHSGPGLTGCPGVNWAVGQTVFLPADF